MWLSSTLMATDLLDIYLVNGAALDAPMPAGAEPDKTEPAYWNRLYRNLGDWRFKDVTEAAGAAGRGYGMGAAVGDYDNDGDPDLYVTNFGRNILLENDGAGSFTDVTAEAGVGGRGWSSGAAFVDYDRDGHLDLFVARYLDWDFSRNIPCGNGLPDRRSYCHPRRFAPIEHLLFRNTGQGKFEDVSRMPPASVLTPARASAWPSATTTATAGSTSSLQTMHTRNSSSATSTASASRRSAWAAGVAYDADGRDFAGMGAAFADYDNDGQPDIFVNALARQSYWLFRNRGGEFRSAARSSGLGPLTDMHSGWGAGLVDFDNDGWRDLFVAQGHVMDDIEWSDPALAFREPFLMLKNVFGRFFDISKNAGSAFRKPAAGRGAAFGDLDNDGRMDIVVNANNERAVVLKNITESSNHWLSVQLIAAQGGYEGRGARIRIETGLGPRAGVVYGFGGQLSFGERYPCPLRSWGGDYYPRTRGHMAPWRGSNPDGYRMRSQDRGPGIRISKQDEALATATETPTRVLQRGALQRSFQVFAAASLQVVIIRPRVAFIA